MPFVKTALFAVDESGDINHYNLIRMRAVGFGKVKIRLLSLSESEEDQCPDIELNKTSPKEQRTLANFTSQRAMIEIKTTTINEYIDCNWIRLFSRWVASEFPE